ncbi:MAG: protein kinase, partial [Myxococcota bacterium]
MADLPTTELTRYELIRCVHRGALGDTWRARGDGVDVALKVARDAGASSHLAREGWASALSCDDALPSFHDAGHVLHVSGDATGRAATARGLPYLAVAWREGETLAAPAGTPETLGALARGLATLHGTGLSHGDVKPENAIFGPRGAAWLDLGFAGPADGVEVRAATPRYLARGDRDLGDARARDLLAFGLVMAELVDDTVAAAERPLDVVRARTRSLPAPFDEIVEALTAPTPWSRPDAAWVAARLGAPRATL